MREFLRRGRKVRFYVFEHADTIQQGIANATTQSFIKSQRIATNAPFGQRKKLL